MTGYVSHQQPPSSRSSPIPASKSSEPSGEAEEAGEEAMDEEVEKEEEEGEGVDPTLLGDLHHTVSIIFMTVSIVLFAKIQYLCDCLSFFSSC